ncbi:hypothetical protein K431DRAFT_96099 [Polychaeton citri CBS 116435]|uniref:Uncharacterized protein n=1 Tax=Polychaeton citri CBS 116435 TaxID=1314669 RepID=A0A9P4UP77_9PEZI|nr:hypothetical protein K431DRAFT_96099 [Polychaeton citri CBS 116435]
MMVMIWYVDAPTTVFSCIALETVKSQRSAFASHRIAPHRSAAQRITSTVAALPVGAHPAALLRTHQASRSPLISVASRCRALHKSLLQITARLRPVSPPRKGTVLVVKEARDRREGNQAARSLLREL